MSGSLAFLNLGLEHKSCPFDVASRVRLARTNGEIAVTLAGNFRSALMDFYVHQVPNFRGKWRILSPFAKMVNGTSVRSGYGSFRLGMDVHDRTFQLGVTARYGTVVSNEVERLNPGDCFIDVGANCGVFALLAAERVGPEGLVVSFEPCFSTFAKLVRNIHINDAENILPFNMALSALTRPELLDNSAVGHSGRFAIAPDAIERGGERVMSLSIQDFPGLLKLIGDRRILVKIDVEGFEHSVLQGLEPILALPQTCGVVVEVDEKNLGRYGVDPQAIYALLYRHGFSWTNDVDAASHFDAVFHRESPLSRDQQVSSAFPLEAARRRTARQENGMRWVHLSQIAAAVLLVIGGWMIARTGFSASAPPAEYFVEEALQSHDIAQVRTRLRRSPPAVYDPQEVAAFTRIALPKLPAGWRVIDVQLFPSDSGASLQMTISNGKSASMSLFAVRDDKVAPSRPDVMSRNGTSVACWQEGDLAYALVSRNPPAEIDRLAEDIADNVTS
ncbi:FkbM family methyltransferase [Sphingobium sp. TCM1]|uniref:FkbM family methyltransferase n=1 Tax=Sphingobium sp. TCM1 TaxID=453246 RepID=UPI000AFD1900|nr:FkbM family methyltransferase [Sphingobium sp. TCM1]